MLPTKEELGGCCPLSGGAGAANVQVQGGVLSEGQRGALDAIGEVLSMEGASSSGSADLGTSHLDPTHPSPYSQQGRGRGRGRSYTPSGKCKRSTIFQ